MFNNLLYPLLHPIRWFKRLSWNTIKNWFKRLYAIPLRKLKSLGRRQLAQVIGGYLSSTLLGTYAFTSLFTPAHFLNPAQVIRVAEKSGIVNMLTFGLASPAFEGSKLAVGNLLSSVGGAFHLDTLSSQGQGFITSANDYFKDGLGTFENGLQIDFNLNPFDMSVLGGGENPELEPLPISPVNNVDASVSAPSEADAIAHKEALQPWDEHTAPNFYKVLDVKTSIDQSVVAGNIIYGGFDELGRTKRAIGNITYDMVQESSGWRAGFESDVDSKLAGWGKNAKVTLKLPGGGTYNGYFWNRSHLIADSLGGYKHVYNSDGTINKAASKSEAQNLITGTRMQNVGTNNSGGSGYGGMAFCENMVVQYLKAHQDCAVWYSVEPVYRADELIPRANIVKIVSCDGGLNATVIVYNTAKDVTIDYYTGAVKGV